MIALSGRGDGIFLHSARGAVFEAFYSTAIMIAMVPRLIDVDLDGEDALLEIACIVIHFILIRIIYYSIISQNK